jgi:small subunit ribosomal protein S25e
MGGKKKLNLKQMERMQDKKDTESKDKKKKEKAGGGPKEKKPSAVVPPDAKNEKLVAELKKMHVMTPYAIATRYNIRISAAKEFLHELQENGKIQLVSGSHNLKIYKAD